MNIYELIFAFGAWILLTILIYSITGWKKIIDCYKLWFNKKYWTNYNIIEALSWVTKSIIIIPGLLFEIQIWQFYFLALLTSTTLIWASNKKLLPTLVGFNTLWVWLSMMVIAQNIL